MHGDPGDVAIPARHLARVQTAANVQARPADGVANVAGAPNRPRGAVERCQDPVSRTADELAAVHDQRAPHRLLEAVEQLSPALVADCADALGRAGHVDEEDRREEAFGHELLPP